MMLEDAIDEVCDWLDSEELDLNSPVRESIKRLAHARAAMLCYDNYVLKLLMAAGHVSLEQVTRAHAIADAVAGITKELG